MRNHLILIGTFILLLAAGCSDQSTSPNLPENPTPTAQEMPASVKELLTQYALPDDEAIWYETLSGLDSIPYELIGGCDVYAVTFLWGHLFNDSPPTEDTTDWSGTLSAFGESVVHVRHMIDFEPGQDSVLLHDNPTFAAWISYTTGDFDGLSFLVFFNPNVANAVYPALEFETPQIYLSFSIYQLVRLAAFYQVDNINGVAVHSRRLWQNSCPGGIIEGRWLKDSSFSGSGSFHGYWMNHLGIPVGYLNGIYWTNDDFTRQFSGSVSGLVTDQVIAELEGTWFYDDPRMCPMCGEGHGQFQGTFVYLHNDRTGSVEGEFGDYSLPPDDLDMPFIGIWKMDCPWAEASQFSD